MSGLPRGNGMELFQRRVAVEHAFGRDRDGFVRNASPVSMRDRLDATTPGAAQAGRTASLSQIDTFTLAGGAQTLTLSKLPISGSLNVVMQGIGLEVGSEWTQTGTALSLLAAADARAGMALQVQYDYLVDLPQPISGGDYPTAVKADSPLIYLRLNDPAGSTSAADSSGNGRNTLVSSNPPEFGDPTLLAVDDGAGASITSRSGHFLDVAHASWMDQPTFTIEAVALNNSGGVVCGRDSNSGPGTRVFQFGVGGAATLILFRGGVATTCSGATPTGNHHIAASFDGTTMRVYVDGTMVNSVSLGGAMDQGTLPMTVGNRYENYLGGVVVMQEFAFYAGVLSDARILAHAKAGGFAV